MDHSSAQKCDFYTMKAHSESELLVATADKDNDSLWHCCLLGALTMLPDTRWVCLLLRAVGNINIYDIFADVCLESSRRVVEQLARALDGLPAGMSTRPALKGANDNSKRPSLVAIPCL